MTDLGIADPVNITGMGSLIDKKGAAQNFDPSALEKEIVRGLGGGLQPTATPAKQISFADEFAREVGGMAPPVTRMTRFEPPPPRSADPFGLMDFDLLDSKASMTSQPGASDDLDDLLKSMDKMTVSSPATSSGDLFSDFPSSRLGQITHEERRQQIINQAYGPSTTTGNSLIFSIEKEREDDDKARDLEQIESLLEILADEGENITNIPKVTRAHSSVEIKTVLRHLLLKNDRKRCGSFAEECILLGVHGIEWLFDGRKQYFGHSPDMTDWHKTVQTKLRRMRHDTAAVVSNVMTEFGLGSGTRLFMELIPSALLYSRMRKSQTKGIISDDEFSAATNQMRDYERA